MDSNIKKKFVLLFIVLIFSIATTSIYLPKTVKQQMSFNDAISKNTVDKAGTIKEIAKNDNVWQITINENNYKVSVYFNAVKNKNLLNRLRIGDTIYYSISEKDQESLELKTNATINAHSLKIENVTVFSTEEYDSFIRKMFGSSLVFGWTFSLISVVIVCSSLFFIAILIKQYRKTALKNNI